MSVQFISNPPPSTNFISLVLVNVTSVPSPSSNTQLLIDPSAVMYVPKSEAGIDFIVPPSLTTNPSLSERVIDPPTEVSPSNRFNSVVVTVAPSSISNSASRIAALPMVKPPAVMTPDVVIVDEPVLIVPNPEVIEPASKAPTSTTLATVVIDACVPPVTVAAVPVALPVTLPVRVPTNPVAVTLPVLGL